jgi:hypothetical protein
MKKELSYSQLVAKKKRLAKSRDNWFQKARVIEREIDHANAELRKSGELPTGAFEKEQNKRSKARIRAILKTSEIANKINLLEIQIEEARKKLTWKSIVADAKFRKNLESFSKEIEKMKRDNRIDKIRDKELIGNLDQLYSLVEQLKREHPSES